MSNEKASILLAVRGTAQESLREMRARVFSIVSTAITLFTVFIGWIVQRSAKPSLPETILFICIIMMFGIGNLLILIDIRRGYIKTMGISVRVEKALGLYEAKVFDEEDESIFPSSYLRPIKGKHFQKFELILSCSAIASILIVILRYVY
ncbi:hypothetical protein APA_342 [Pseudanabaena sp. lw0831]|uniref:hypothetical protein n=1 Tax=Pseudanabaena sp. lw0831 TaxID=1357935 RepID=UPI0019162987|nr:hypothetical protein [Pseudanabaena sp. lw0831]GBO52673.1 hypothetical protein APA_342 [Pseudanabaena sp. lw0831]